MAQLVICSGSLLEELSGCVAGGHSCGLHPNPAQYWGMIPACLFFQPVIRAMLPLLPATREPSKAKRVMGEGFLSSCLYKI